MHAENLHLDRTQIHRYRSRDFRTLPPINFLSLSISPPLPRSQGHAPHFLVEGQSVTWIAGTVDDGTWYLGFPRLSRRLGEALFPPRVMRQESRILLVGSTTRFLSWMDWLGLQGDILPSLSHPSAKSMSEHSFEVVLVQGLPEHGTNLHATETLRATAQLLSLVQPGGRLILLGRSEPTWNQYPTGHLRSCYARHLGSFDSDVRVQFFGDSWWNWKTWNWMVGLQPRSGFLAATLTLPSQPLSRSYWMSAALRESSKSVGECCLWSRRQGSPDGKRNVTTRTA